LRTSTPIARTTRALSTLAAAGLFIASISGCPEAEEKHEAITDEVGHAAKNKLDGVNQRLNNSARQATDRLNSAAAAADKAGQDEGGW
jgi:two-component sensor histidine kinase